MTYKPIKCELKYMAKDLAECMSMTRWEWLGIFIVWALFTFFMICLDYIWSFTSSLIMAGIYIFWIYNAHKACKKNSSHKKL